MTIANNFQRIFKDSEIINNVLLDAQTSSFSLTDADTLKACVKDLSAETLTSIFKTVWDMHQSTFKAKNLEHEKCGELAFTNEGEWGKILTGDDRVLILTQIKSVLDDKMQKIFTDVVVQVPLSKNGVKENDQEILSRMHKCLSSFSAVEMAKLFSKLTEDLQKQLATHFYSENRRKFQEKDKDVLNCAYETLKGNEYFKEFLSAENLQLPLEILIAEKLSSDHKSNVPMNGNFLNFGVKANSVPVKLNNPPPLQFNISQSEVEVISYLSEISSPQFKIVWNNSDPVSLDKLREFGICSLKDLFLLDVKPENIQRIQEIKFPMIDWTQIDLAKNSADRIQMVKATEVWRNVSFKKACDLIVKEVQLTLERTEPFDISCAATDCMKTDLLKGVEELYERLIESTNNPMKNWQFFADKNNFKKVEDDFKNILIKFLALEKQRQVEIMSSYFGQNGLVAFWKNPSNINKSLSDLAHQNKWQYAKFFTLTF